ncbi:hypothetical protein Sste5346_000126 [Sporothrix stenoceras]|uniref:Uncharacterized protein n=1 Tax=Sporothrix stenoceras TaxID=5173 RepID=A0ABR3ZY59_9PEZI
MSGRNNSYFSSSSSRTPASAPLYQTPSRSSTMSSSSTQTQFAGSYDMPAYDYTSRSASDPLYRTRTGAAGPSSSSVSSSSSSGTYGSADAAPARAGVYRTTSSSTYASSASYASSYTSSLASSTSLPSSMTSPTLHSSGRSYAGSVAGSTAGGSSKKTNVNVYTTCGRHSNEWLFSGWPSPFRRRDGN